MEGGLNISLYLRSFLVLSWWLDHGHGGVSHHISRQAPSRELVECEMDE